MYGIHRDPMGFHRGSTGSIGTLWVMYGIHRDPMGLYSGCMEFYRDPMGNVWHP